MTTTALQTVPAARPSALSVMATRFNVEPAKLLDTLKNTAFKNATDSQMMALCVVANEMNLNPFTREIFAFPDKTGGIVPVVSIDGWLRRINEHPQFDGIEFDTVEGEDGKPVSVTAKIFRRDRTKPTVVTEYFIECHRNTDPWNRSPRRMLRHRATIQCARIAFGYSGGDEDEVIDVETVVAPAAPRAVFTQPQVADIPDAMSNESVQALTAAFDVAQAKAESAPPAPTPAPQSEKEKLAAAILDAKFTFDDFKRWAEVSGNCGDVSAMSSFDDIHEATAKRLMRSVNGIIRGIREGVK